MTKRRDTLQRISRIDNIHTVQYEMQEDVPCGRFIGFMTIEAVLDLYMTEISSPIMINFCLLPEQYRKRQEKERLLSTPASVLSTAVMLSPFPEERFVESENQAEALSLSDKEDTNPELAEEQKMTFLYDALDENRGSGFLFYSYDRHGAHSILGEQRAGGYGDYMVSGTFSAGY